MRIISGKFKSRRFNPPADKWPTRPTTDTNKESLFNILHNSFDFEELKVLDIFGGTGSHSYEFISRGCEDVTYVDNFGGCVGFVKKTAKELEISDHLKILKMDVFKFVERTNEQYDYIFAGPPYPLPRLPLIPDLIFKNQLLKPNGWLVVEHNTNNDFHNNPRLFNVRTYGSTIFSFFSNEANNEEE